MTSNWVTVIIIALELFILLLCILNLNIEKRKPGERWRFECSNKLCKPIGSSRPILQGNQGFWTSNKTRVEDIAVFGETLQLPVRSIKLNKSKSGPVGHNVNPRPNCNLCFCYKGTFTTFLVSYPSSGSTWLRHLIQQATGFYTGSQYMDRDLKGKGFLGEGIWDDSCLTIKTHYPYITDSLPLVPTHAILLIRKPLEAFKSEFHRAITRNHTGVVKFIETRIEKSKWNTYLHTNLTAWDMLYSYWLMKEGVKIHVIQYENLVRNMKGELKTVLQFLQISVSEKDMLCAMENSEGVFHRKKSKQSDILETFVEETSRQRLLSIYIKVMNMAIEIRSSHSTTTRY